MKKVLVVDAEETGVKLPVDGARHSSRVSLVARRRR
jgi:hypothetical protein